MLCATRSTTLARYALTVNCAFKGATGSQDPTALLAM